MSIKVGGPTITKSQRRPARVVLKQQEDQKHAVRADLGLIGNAQVVRPLTYGERVFDAPRTGVDAEVAARAFVDSVLNTPALRRLEGAVECVQHDFGCKTRTKLEIRTHTKVTPLVYGGAAPPPKVANEAGQDLTFDLAKFSSGAKGPANFILRKDGEHKIFGMCEKVSETMLAHMTSNAVYWTQETLQMDGVRETMANLCLARMGHGADYTMVYRAIFIVAAIAKAGTGVFNVKAVANSRVHHGKKTPFTCLTAPVFVDNTTISADERKMWSLANTRLVIKGRQIILPATVVELLGAGPALLSDFTISVEECCRMVDQLLWREPATHPQMKEGWRLACIALYSVEPATTTAPNVCSPLYGNQHFSTAGQHPTRYHLNEFMLTRLLAVGALAAHVDGHLLTQHFESFVNRSDRVTVGMIRSLSDWNNLLMVQGSTYGQGYVPNISQRMLWGCTFEMWAHLDVVQNGAQLRPEGRLLRT